MVCKTSPVLLLLCLQVLIKSVWPYVRNNLSLTWLLEHKKGEVEDLSFLNWQNGGEVIECFKNEHPAV